MKGSDMEHDLIETLEKIRKQALELGTEKLGSHQLDAHLSIAFACQVPPTAWELYRAPSLHLMPETGFYKSHAIDIQAVLQPAMTWILLGQHATPKLQLDAGLSSVKRKAHGFPGNAQYYDARNHRWVQTTARKVRWFDGRDSIRGRLNDTREALKMRTNEALSRHQAAAKTDPSLKNRAALAAYEKFIQEGLPNTLRSFDRDKADSIAWLKLLDATPDFGKTVFNIVRQAENTVRASMGVPLIGESWVSETELLYRVRQLLPTSEVIHHGKPAWLGRQHLDIWLPSLNVAIEYQGAQHFQPIDFFGGDVAFIKSRERDTKKRDQCRANGVRLIEIAYDKNVSNEELLQTLKK